MLRSLCAVLILQASAAADRPSRFAVRPTVDGAQHRSLLSLLGGAVAGDAAMLSEAPSASADPAAPPFSLEGLLKGCEHKGYREASQPRGVALAPAALHLGGQVPLTHWLIHEVVR